MFSLFNKYCSLCSYATDVINSIYTVCFDKLPATKAIGSVKTTSIKDGLLDFGERPHELTGTFGRTIDVKGGTTNTSEVIVQGFDYLGQKMTEKFTLNNTSKVVGKKAFKYVTSIKNTKGTADTITISEGLFIGLPYRTSKILSETRNGVESSTSKLVVPENITQTAKTGDPRGTINLATYSSPANIVLVCVASPEIFNIDGQKVGGLYGFPQYFE